MENKKLIIAGAVTIGTILIAGLGWLAFKHCVSIFLTLKKCQKTKENEPSNADDKKPDSEPKAS